MLFFIFPNRIDIKKFAEFLGFLSYFYLFVIKKVLLVGMASNSWDRDCQIKSLFETISRIGVNVIKRLMFLYLEEDLRVVQLHDSCGLETILIVLFATRFFILGSSSIFFYLLFDFLIF